MTLAAQNGAATQQAWSNVGTVLLGRGRRLEVKSLPPGADIAVGNGMQHLPAEAIRLLNESAYCRQSTLRIEDRLRPIGLTLCASV